MDAQLRALERASASGDPESTTRLKILRMRSGWRHDYASEITVYKGKENVKNLRAGWVMVPRRLVPRSKAHRPPRFDMVVEFREYMGRYSPLTVRAVVPEIWWRGQTGRLGQDVVDEWLAASRVRRQQDEQELAELRQAHESAWIELMGRLAGGPQVMRRPLVASVRRQLLAHPEFVLKEVGSTRIVCGRAADPRFQIEVEKARERSARAKRGAETRKRREEAESERQRNERRARRQEQRRRTQAQGKRAQAHGKPIRRRPSRRMEEAVSRLRAELGTHGGLVSGSTQFFRELMRLSSGSETGRLLSTIRDGRLHGATDLKVSRQGRRQGRRQWQITH